MHRCCAHLVPTACRGNEEGCIDGRPDSHHEEELCEDSIDLHAIVDSQPTQLLKEVHVPVGCLVRAEQQRIACTSGGHAGCSDAGWMRLLFTSEAPKEGSSLTYKGSP